jgi:hypothetical protein
MDHFNVATRIHHFPHGCFCLRSGSSVATIQISNVRAPVAVGSADTRTKNAPAMLP